jgi:hypothetical protein
MLNLFFLLKILFVKLLCRWRRKPTLALKQQACYKVAASLSEKGLLKKAMKAFFLPWMRSLAFSALATRSTP